MRKTFIREYIDCLTKTVADLPEDKIREVIDILTDAHAKEKRVFLIGNGGSASTASHIACDLQKGFKESSGKRFRVISLTDNVPIMTAWANDTSYDSIFLEQIDSLVEPGDVVIAISGSGNSENVIKAVELANQRGALTISWSGYDGGRLARLAQKSIVIPSDNMQRIEDVHLILGHLIFTCMMQEYGKNK